MFTAMLQASLGRSMEMLTSARSNGYSSVESGVDHVVHSWVPPIAPTESSPAEHSFLREQTVAATPEDEQLFQFSEQSDLHQILRGSGSERKLIVCTAAVAALAVGALAYVFWSTAVDKKETDIAEAAPALQSESVAPVQAAPRIPEPSLAEPSAVAWPDLPPSVIFDAAPQMAAAAPNTAARQTVPPWDNADIVFLQRPGVNIRSTPSANGTVVGAARKGTRFQVTNREGDWVQVEGDRLKGWINSQFLGPNDAR
jgi:Bacterial SH3 domain